MKQHQFTLTGKWQGGRNGQGTIVTNGLETTVSAPLNMNGLGIGTSSEEMLLGASATCYLITLGLMLQKRNIDVEELTIQSQGILVEDPVLRYDRIIHRPIIIIKENDPEMIQQAQTIAILAERNCMISAAIRGNVDVQVEPTVTSS
ncbi:OsmC family protein [Fodinisporobacter ferrooxydans]|uniref:OsmC family protein n=1 Tax=Fodinisporobacter ferrooxydans TaxID=2901836 RepID=A0ABY4CE41_9BACL|nr:OsmC family protein [Alicyclobacillaceae bacterium MYW30-H2]